MGPWTKQVHCESDGSQDSLLPIMSPHFVLWATVACRSPGMSVNSEPVPSNLRTMWAFPVPQCTATLVNGCQSLWGRFGGIFTASTCGNDARSCFHRTWPPEGFWVCESTWIWKLQVSCNTSSPTFLSPQALEFPLPHHNPINCTTESRFQ